ncbi:MAG: hypothetical protein HY903_23795 [Deltaproteobacteria bacterium]|nr:hypothetical protein [Deltaproteobacteria bacterium]
MKTMKLLPLVLTAILAGAGGCKEDKLDAAPSCKDGQKNQDETGVDCGGLLCGACRLNGACQRDLDCYVGICTNGTCDASATPLTEVQLCALYIMTAAAGDSSPCTTQPVLSAADFNPEQTAYACRPGTEGRSWAHKLLAAVAENRVSVDWTLAKQCLDQTRYLRMAVPGLDMANGPEWAAARDGICKTFHTGKLAQSATCVEDWDCPEGLGCYTTTPTIGGSRQCMAGGGVNDACDEFRPCDAKLTCGTNGRCTSPTIPPTKARGENCSASTECNSADCSICRQASTGARTTCQMIGKVGDYCADWNDCALDLGCVNHVCGLASIGQACCVDAEVCAEVTSLQAMCDPTAAYCLQTVDCESFTTSSACGGSPLCYWDGEACTAGGGQCVAKDALATSGACYGLGYCAPGSYCNGASACVPFGREGASCDDVTPCNEDVGFTCTLAGTCGHVCEYNEDCPAGSYCGDANGDDEDECVPFASTTCASSSECAPPNWCDIQGAQCFKFTTPATCGLDSECSWTIEGTCERDDTCATHTDSTTCGADTTQRCGWLPVGTCKEPACEAFTAEGTCTAPGCQWLADYSEGPGCYPRCWEFDGNMAGCTGNTNCHWDGQYCWYRCKAPTSQNDATECGRYPGCVYSPGTPDHGCRGTEDCARFNSNLASCNTALCALDGSTYCASTNATGEGSCVAPLPTGSPCVPEDQEGAATAADMGYNDAYPNPGMPARACADGYAQNVTGSANYVCSVPPSAPNEDCGGINNTMHSIITTVFMFGSALFIRRRRRLT